MRPHFLGLLCISSALGCFETPSHDGKLCDRAMACPSGYYCDEELLCRLGTKPSESDAGFEDASETDGGDDAGLMDVPDSGVQIPCTETATRACYDGPANTRGEGICHDGTQTCASGVWGGCEGSVLPSVETCDGVDQDCDGAEDNGPNECAGVCALSVPIGTACDAADPDDLDTCLDDTYVCDGRNAVQCVNAGVDGDSDRYSEGVLACNGDCQDGDAAINPDAIEICNGVDDNCDDVIDEGCNYDPAACQVTPPPLANTTLSAPIPSCATNYFVSPIGDDTNDGLTAGTAFENIDRGLQAALPGDCVSLAPGEYLQNVSTVRAGTASAPITITGPSTAVVRGAGRFYVMFVSHDYIYLNGFTIDGLVGNPADVAGYRDKLIRIYGDTANVGVQGVVLRGLTLQNALRGCVRIRYLSTDHEVVNNDFSNCRMYYELTGLEHTEGDGVHVGTYPPQLNTNPTAVPDTSGRVWIHNNTFTNVAQCVEIQGHAVGSVVEQNQCDGSASILMSGSFEIAGDWNVFRNNTAADGAGSGIRIVRVQTLPGICNVFEGNTVNFNARTGFWLDAAPQLRACGNFAMGNGVSVSGGTFAPLYDVLAACP